MIQMMTYGPHGPSKWVEYKVVGRTAKLLEYSTKISFTHWNDDGPVITTFRKV